MAKLAAHIHTARPHPTGHCLWNPGGLEVALPHIPCPGGSGDAESCLGGWQGCVPPSAHPLPVCLPALCQVHQGHTECGAGLRGPAGKSDTSRVTKGHSFGAGPDLTLLFSAGQGPGFPTHPWPSSCPASSQTTGIVPGLQGTVGPPEPGRQMSSHCLSWAGQNSTVPGLCHHLHDTGRHWVLGSQSQNPC